MSVFPIYHFRTLMRPAFNLSLYFVLSPHLCGGHEAALRIAKQALSGGVSMMQIRAPEWHKKAILTLAKDILPMTRDHGVPLLIDDHVDVAIASGVDGVHVGQKDLPAMIARELMGENKIVGLSGDFFLHLYTLYTICYSWNYYNNRCH